MNGTVVDANVALADDPELVNTDPYGEGWIFRMAPDDEEAIESLMSPDDYESFVESGD